MARSFVAFGMAFAGLWLLAGPGCALLAGAVLVFALWPRDADAPAVEWLSRVTVAAQAVAVRVKAAPRRAAAVSGMAGAVALIPAGFGVAIGLGVGLAVAGFALAGLSLLAGWNA